MHVACAPLESTYVPPEHSLTHEPPLRKGVAVAVQLRHWLAEGPLQVPHAPSHGAQTDEPLAYLPSAVHDARHVPASGLKKGKAAAHDVQSAAAGPVQVAHDEWHRAHVSADEALPPEHV